MPLTVITAYIDSIVKNSKLGKKNYAAEHPKLLRLVRVFLQKTRDKI